MFRSDDSLHITFQTVRYQSQSHYSSLDSVPNQSFLSFVYVLLDMNVRLKLTSMDQSSFLTSRTKFWLRLRTKFSQKVVRQ